MMSQGVFVVDSSVSLASLFDEPADNYTEATLQNLAQSFSVATRDKALRQAAIESGLGIRIA